MDEHKHEWQPGPWDGALACDCGMMEFRIKTIPQVEHEAIPAFASGLKAHLRTIDPFDGYRASPREQDQLAAAIDAFAAEFQGKR